MALTLALPAPADQEPAVAQAPQAFRAAAERVLPSVVTIETYGGVSATGRASRGPGKGRRPPGAPGGPGQGPQIRGISRPGEGPTTGLIISADGYVITSTFNFIRKPPIVTVALPDGSQHVAKLLGRDDTRGLQLLKIESLPEGAKLHVPTLVPVDGVTVGQWAISVGVGYGGDEPALSAGIISAKNRIFGKAVQTDANTSPANYGGPLIDLDGRVIGLCVPLSPQGGAGVEWYDSGIGFAVPLAGADELIERMKRGEVIEPGRLGVQAKPGPAGAGVTIAKVMDKSPAQEAGLKDGDVVVTVNGQKIIDLVHLKSIIGRFVAGQRVTLEIKRGDQTLKIEATLSAGQDAPDTPPTKPIEIGPKKKD
jgi:serine protease Do